MDLADFIKILFLGQMSSFLPGPIGPRAAGQGGGARGPPGRGLKLVKLGKHRQAVENVIWAQGEAENPMMSHHSSLVASERVDRPTPIISATCFSRVGEQVGKG